MFIFMRQRETVAASFLLTFLLKPGRHSGPVISPEGVGGKSGGVEKVADGVVSPAVADGNGMRDFFRRDDYLITFNPSSSPVPDLVGTSNLESRQLPCLGSTDDVIRHGIRAVTGLGKRTRRNSTKA